MSSSRPPGVPAPARACGPGPDADPETSAASTSTVSPNPNPSFCTPDPAPPSHSRWASPRSNAAGSVTGSFRSSASQPTGTGCPSRAAARTLPVGAAVVLMSSTNGWCWPVGAATLNGLVPSIASRPPGGRAMRCPPQFPASRPTIPCAAARSVWCPAQPKWVAPRTDTTPTPWSVARRTARSMACPASHSPMARRPSSSTVAPRSATTRGTARGSTAGVEQRQVQPGEVGQAVRGVAGEVAVTQRLRCGPRRFPGYAEPGEDSRGEIHQTGVRHPDRARCRRAHRRAFMDVASARSLGCDGRTRRGRATSPTRTRTARRDRRTRRRNGRGWWRGHPVRGRR